MAETRPLERVATLKGWVQASASEAAGRGRPAQDYSLVTPPGYAMGLDIGPHTVRCVMVDLGGVVVHRAERAVESVATLRHTVAKVAEGCASAVGSGETWLTSIAMGGYLTPDGLIRRSVALPDWEGRNPADVLAGDLPGERMVVNDVRAATWAERVLGAARGYDEVLLAHLGRRPTMGLLVDGAPRRGAHGTAGDMSLANLLPGEEHMDWLNAYQDLPDPLGHAVRAAAAGDEGALAGAKRYMDQISPALAFAIAVVDPAVVVIGGAFTPLAAHFLEPLSEYLELHVQNPPKVVASELDQFASATGAALSGLRRMNSLLLSPDHGVAPFTQDGFRERVELRGRL